MQITTRVSETDTARVEFFTFSNPSTDYRIYGLQASTGAEAVAALNAITTDWVMADLYIGGTRTLIGQLPNITSHLCELHQVREVTL